MFIRVRKIKNGYYRYQEERWREGGKVRSRSTCLGAASAVESAGFIRRQLGRSYGLNWDAIAKEVAAREQSDKEKLDAHLSQLHADFGLKLGPAIPVEVEKPVTVVDLSAAAPAHEAEENAPSDDGAEASGSPGL